MTAKIMPISTIHNVPSHGFAPGTYLVPGLGNTYAAIMSAAIAPVSAAAVMPASARFANQPMRSTTPSEAIGVHSTWNRRGPNVKGAR